VTYYSGLQHKHFGDTRLVLYCAFKRFANFLLDIYRRKHNLACVFSVLFSARLLLQRTLASGAAHGREAAPGEQSDDKGRKNNGRSYTF
jgi:hypothetical protein